MAQTTLRDRIQSIEDAVSAGHIDGAMADCKELLTRYPDALEIQRLLGEVYLAQGRLEEAQQTFDWILVNDPENVIAYCDRALICEHQSDIDTALDCYQQAYELSRGNSQIRKEFNHLSAQAGQQEFMLSRAGLARLYMRGDLLTQAIQEWEAVLAAAPDRLDARLGLMETYWREGMYDHVEQIASRILEDIPNCEKALLLQAHVTSAFNMQRARELIQRAELFDPELVMAQELFGDLAASQPHDPFLAIVRRDAIILNGQTNGNGKQIETMSTNQYAAVEVEDAVLEAQSASADRLYNWNAQDSLAELDTRALAQPKALPASAASSTTNRADDATLQQVPEQQPVSDDFDAWASQQEIDDDYDPALLEQQPWFQAEQATSSPASDKARNDSQPGLLELSDPWDIPAQSNKEEVPPPPAWLDMLTRSEPRQPEQASPTAPAAPTPAPQTPIPPSEPERPAQQYQPEAIPVPMSSWEDDAQSISTLSESGDTTPPFFFTSDDNEEDMGWPEWLKSLGAETIEPAQTPEAEAQPTYSAWSDLQQSVSSSNLNSSPFDSWLDVPQAEPTPSQPEAPLTYDPWADHSEQEPAHYGTWEEQIDAPVSEDERAQLATLESVEKQLLSQGFVPLQPGALSTLAQESGYASSPSKPEEPVDAPGENPPAPAQTQASTWSATTPTPTPVEQPWWNNTPFLAPEPEMPVNVPGESVAASVAQAQPEISAAPEITPAEPVAMPVAQAQQQQAPTPMLATSRDELLAAPPAPAYRPDALLENELETTMKRPAVRLQPMQTAAGRANAANLGGKGRPAESKPVASDSPLSHKGQLLKGYQYQLTGAYDDAMQEYRITIRNAPELLDEVISNLRALLKLAPRYTAGYRVLGDAYMRQGEYLQAMEAYNKALTMAKKAKSQSH